MCLNANIQLKNRVLKIFKSSQIYSVAKEKKGIMLLPAGALKFKTPSYCVSFEAILHYKVQI